MIVLGDLSGIQPYLCDVASGRGEPADPHSVSVDCTAGSSVSYPARSPIPSVG